jgi:sulfofructose kinase
MASGRRHLIALGAICATTILRVDRILPAPAKLLASRMCRVADGMAVSAACAFVRLGGSAQLWARVGDDSLGEEARQELASEGVDVSHVRAVPGGATSHSSVVVDGAGERLVVVFHDPDVDASPGWLPLESLRGAGMLHCDVRWPEGAEAAMLAARRHGIARMLDGDVAPRSVLERLVPLATHAVFSDAGLLAYTGRADVAAALQEVAAHGPAHVGATCGPDGYAWIERGEVRRVPAPRVEVVDTLAAGDVFHGAFALALLEGRSIEAAARFACVAASIKCERFGGRLGCPDRAAVDARVAAAYGAAAAP